MEEVTYQKFSSNIKSFMKKLFSEPISCQINDTLKDLGFTKESLVNDLEKRNFIKKITKIDNAKTSEKDAFTVTYQFFGKGFDRKMERFYNDWKKENLSELNEAAACGAVTPGIGGNGTMGNTGAYEKPFQTEKGKTNVIRKAKTVHFTPEQLNEVTSTFGAGNYQYPVPFPTKKNDPTLSREPGFSMKRLK